MSRGELIFFDLETGGLDETRHPVIQFAGIAVGPGWAELETLELKVKFDPATAEPDALRVNGWTAEAWRAALAPTRAQSEITAFLLRHATLTKTGRSGRPYQVAEVAAHNAPFDARFLAAWFKRAGIFLPAACFEALDTVDLARWVSRGWATEKRPANHKLGTLCEHYGIPHQDAHDALGDVRATVLLARHLCELCGLEVL